jgi:hypothetical protein
MAAQRLLGGGEIDSAMLQVRKALETIKNAATWNWPGRKAKGEVRADERWALIRAAMEDQASGVMHVDPGTRVRLCADDDPIPPPTSSPPGLGRRWMRPARATSSRPCFHATLRTCAPLVGAGLDRIAHAYLAARVLSLTLATRAETQLALAGSKGTTQITDLFEQESLATLAASTVV